MRKELIYENRLGIVEKIRFSSDEELNVPLSQKLLCLLCLLAKKFFYLKAEPLIKTKEAKNGFFHYYIKNF